MNYCKNLVECGKHYAVPKNQDLKLYDSINTYKVLKQAKLICSGRNWIDQAKVHGVRGALGTHGHSICELLG